MNKKKGFTLIELVISMLVVAIAMLGFAALMAYSSRSIHSGYAKSAGTNAAQGFVRLLQNNRNVVTSLFVATNNNNPIVLSVSNFNTLISEADFPGFKDLLDNEFQFVNRMPGIAVKADGANCNEVQIRVNRNIIDANYPDLSVYDVEVNLAYQPLSTDQNINCPVAESLVRTYCPFDNNQTDKLVKDRIDNNIVCDTLRTRL